MLKKALTRIAAIACVCTLIGVALVGCTTAPPKNDEQTANRQYMSQVNQIAESLKVRMESFSDAVSRNDLVGMKTQADNAFKVIDELNNITPPDNLKDIQGEYSAGCNDLRDSLNGYISLYSDIESASAAAPFDYASYASRLDQCQQKYNSGIDHLKNGDQKATQMG